MAQREGKALISEANFGKQQPSPHFLKSPTIIPQCLLEVSPLVPLRMTCSGIGERGEWEFCLVIPLLEYACGGEQESLPQSPWPALVHPLLRVSAGIRLRREGSPALVPKPAPGPHPFPAQGLCWNTPVGGEQESCPGPLPAHYLGASAGIRLHSPCL